MMLKPLKLLLDLFTNLGFRASACKEYKSTKNR